MAELVQSHRLNHVQCKRLNQVQSALSNWPIFYNPATRSASLTVELLCCTVWLSTLASQRQLYKTVSANTKTLMFCKVGT